MRENEFLQKGLACLQDNNLDEALICFKKAKKINNKSFDALVNIAVVHFLKRDFYKAISSFKTALKSYPKNETILFNLALSYQQTGKLKLAKRYLEILLSINSKHVQANNTLGTIYFDLGEQQKALDIFKYASKLDKSFDLPLYNIGRAYFENDEFRKAREYLEKALKLNFDANTINLLFRVYRETNEWEKLSSLPKDTIDYENPFIALTRTDDQKRLFKIAKNHSLLKFKKIE